MLYTQYAVSVRTKYSRISLALRQCLKYVHSDYWCMLVQLFAFRIEYIKKNHNTRSVWPLHRYFQRRLYAIHTYMTYYVHWSRHLKQTSFQCPFDRSIFKFIMSITITEHGATTTSHFVEVNIKILHKAYYYTHAQLERCCFAILQSARAPTRRRTCPRKLQ